MTNITWTGSAVLISEGEPVNLRVVSEPPAIPLAGDLVAALTVKLGVDQAAKWVADRLGVDCGCAERRRKLNELDSEARAMLGL